MVQISHDVWRHIIFIHVWLDNKDVIGPSPSCDTEMLHLFLGFVRKWLWSCAFRLYNTKPNEVWTVFFTLRDRSSVFFHIGCRLMDCPPCCCVRGGGKHKARLTGEGPVGRAQPAMWSLDQSCPVACIRSRKDPSSPFGPCTKSNSKNLKASVYFRRT